MSNLLNLKSFFKFLGRNKGYTAIDLFGLSVSLMFVILIATYVTGELMTDRYHEKADRIYVLGNGEYTRFCLSGRLPPGRTLSGDRESVPCHDTCLRQYPVEER